MNRRSTFGVVVAASVLAGVALVAPAVLGSTASQSQAEQAAEPPPAPTAEVTLDQGSITMPTTLRAGLNTFTVRGQGRLQLVKVKGSYTAEQLIADYVAGAQNGQVEPLRTLEKKTVFVGGADVKSGGTVTAQIVLPKGKLLAFDSLAPTASKVLAVQTVGPVVRGAPTGTTKFAAIDPNRFSGESETAAPSGTLLFANSSSDNHFVAVKKLLRGKKLSDFSRWVSKYNADPTTAGAPPLDQTAPDFVSPVIAPFASVAATYSLPAGDYVVACYWPDAEMGGMKHVFMGMYQGTTLK